MVKVIERALSVIGVIATVLALAFAVLAYTRPPQAQQLAMLFVPTATPATPEPTPTPYPTYTPAPIPTSVTISHEVTREVTREVIQEVTREVPVTMVSEVTRIVPVTVVVMPTPQATLVPPETENTPAGSTLQVGEWWKSDGVWLALDRVEYEDSGWICVFPKLSNKTDQRIIFAWDTVDNIKVTDNTGHRYEIHSQYGYSDLGETVEPGKTIWLNAPSYEAAACYVDSFVYSSSVKELYITIEGVSRIGSARWISRVPK